MSLGPILHPIILSKMITENRAEMRLKIPEDLAYFEGHFPGFLIVPGVVQLHWAVEYAQEIFTLPPGVGQGNQIKFNQLMRPLDELDLILEHDPLKSVVAYCYREDEKTYSSGKFMYS
jgi:3-hydroxymyristoyl/3-hydroxydecanoyl-(acyl carrier protein) dehydratase